MSGDLYRRQRVATLKLVFVGSLLLLGLGIWGVWNWLDPDPQGEASDELGTVSQHLAQQAGYSLDDEPAPEARRRFAQGPFDGIPRIWVFDSRVVGSDQVEWDVALGAGAHSSRFGFGSRWIEFHTCFRLSGEAGTLEPVRRTDIDCPARVSTDPIQRFGASTEIHLDDDEIPHGPPPSRYRKGEEPGG